MEDCAKQPESIVVMDSWPAPRKGKRQWSSAFKKELVMRLLRGEPVHGISREACVPEYKLERWRNCALVGIDVALRERESDSLQACLEEAYRRIDELSQEVERLRKRSRSKRTAQDRSCAGDAARLSLDILAS